MNAIRKYTLRNLWKNRRRTTLTIVGLILGISLITGIAVFLSSLVHTFRLEETYSTGGYHGRVYSTEALKVSEENDIDAILFKEYKGYDPTFLEEDQNLGDPYEEVILDAKLLALDDEGWATYEDRLTEGRLPQNESEFVVSTWMIHSNYLKIGDTLPFSVQQQYNEAGEITIQGYDAERVTDTGETKEMTLVGFLDLPYENVSSFAVLYTRDNTPDSAAGIYDITLKDVTKASIAQLEKDFPSVSLNQSLLGFYLIDVDQITSSVYSVFSVVLTVLLILIGMPIVAVFANAFGISLAERTRAMGMLSSIGATRKQLRRSVFFEALVIGIIAIPFGLLAGVGGIAVTLHFISDLVQGSIFRNPLQFHVEPYWLVLGALGASVMLLISAWIPASRVSSITPIDAIRSSRDVKLTRKQVKTSSFTRRIFRKEGELALKNLKRNNKQYRFTVVSLVISLVMLLGTMTFSHYLHQSVELETKGYNISLELYLLESDEVPSALEAAKSFMNSPGVIDSARQFSTFNFFVIPERLTHYTRQLPIHFIEDQEFNTIKGTLPTEASFEDDGLQLILLDRVPYESEEVIKGTKTLYQDRGPMTAEVGLWSYDDHVKDQLFLDAQILGVSDYDINKEIMGDRPSGMMVVAAYSDLEQFIEQWPQDERYHKEQVNVYFLAEDPAAFEESLNEHMSSSDYAGTSRVHNHALDYERMTNVMRFGKVMIYGLIILLALTALSNVVNTLSTSYSLRMKEFAMLRSVGMGQASFNRMINFEIIFYLIKTLIYGLPISAFFIWILYKELGISVGAESVYVPWIPLLGSVVVLGLILILITRLARRKIKKSNIIETLRTDIT